MPPDSRAAFLRSLENELAVLQQEGRITPEEAGNKRTAAARIETGFSGSPAYAARQFAEAGVPTVAQLKAQFLEALENKLDDLVKSGRITTQEANKKREAAALIQTGFSRDPAYDALVFALSGIAGEQELANTHRNRGKKGSRDSGEDEEEDAVQQPPQNPRLATPRARPKGSYKEKQAKARADKRAIRIGNILGIFMILVAIRCDALQIAVQVFHVIPVAGTALALILPLYVGVMASWIVFPIWFKIQGVKMFSGWLTPLRIAALLIPAIVEFVAFVNSLPLISIGVIITLILTRLEDVLQSEEKMKEALAKAKNPKERRKIQQNMNKRFYQGRPYEYQADA